MPERRVPSVRARQLARALRRLRELDGRTGEEIAALLDWSNAKISRIETASTAIKVTDLRRLLAVYEVPEDQVEELSELARSAGKRGWWDAYKGIDETYQTYIGLENEASALHCYSPLAIHGLLQTEAYAREIIDVVVLPPGEVERRVQIRLRRQQRLLDDSNSLELWAVLDEAAIRRQVGGTETMTAQLERLLEIGTSRNVTIQVLPFSAGAHPATWGPFIILKFPYQGDDVVYVELMESALYIENETDVFKHTLAFDVLRGLALSPEDSVRLIEQTITGV
jgi:transcriptional regulator with XRE-family HTH domain